MTTYMEYGRENTQSVYSGNGMGQHYTNPLGMIVRRAVRLTNEVDATNILDLACGRGVTSLAIAQETSVADIVAIDINREGVTELLEIATQLGVHNSIQAYVYDAAEPTGYADILTGKRDVVVAKDLYPFLNPNQIGQMLQNVQEALRPGGWFMLTAASTRSRAYQESGSGSAGDEFYRELSPGSKESIQTSLDYFTFTNISDLSQRLEGYGMEMTEAEHIGRAGGWIMALAQKIQ